MAHENLQCFSVRFIRDFLGGSVYHFKSYYAHEVMNTMGVLNLPCLKS